MVDSARDTDNISTNVGLILGEYWRVHLPGLSNAAQSSVHIYGEADELRILQWSEWHLTGLRSAH